MVWSAGSATLGDASLARQACAPGGTTFDFLSRRLSFRTLRSSEPSALTQATYHRIAVVLGFDCQPACKADPSCDAEIRG